MVEEGFQESRVGLQPAWVHPAPPLDLQKPSGADGHILDTSLSPAAKRVAPSNSLSALGTHSRTENMRTGLVKRRQDTT